MPRRHPGSTLFPYTTLFRSGVGVPVADRFTVTALRYQPLVPAVPVRVGVVLGTVPVTGLTVIMPTCRSQTPKPLQTRSEIDRKSTRLNSSHGYISYAVFCLK